jgi:hypothetical protein
MRDLVNSSLERIERDYTDAEFGIFTFWRKDLSDDANRENILNVARDVQRDGYKYVPLDAVVERTDNLDQIAILIPMILLLNRTDNKLAQLAFTGALWSVTSQYKQAGYLWKKPGDIIRCVDTDSAEEYDGSPSDFLKYIVGNATTGELTGLKYGDPPGSRSGSQMLHALGATDLTKRETVDDWQAASRDWYDDKYGH